MESADDSSTGTTGESGGSGESGAGGFPVVGLGASAGGLAALEDFFSAMPVDSGMAFVVVTHQQAGKPSLLAELLARKTSMPVAAVSTTTPVVADHVYLAEPGYNLAILNGVLQPMHPVAATTGERAHLQLPIDYFFRSLARDQKHRAVGIVLSGTGSDGTLGLKEIKAELGIAMAQNEQSAQYSGMPHSAISRLLVDHVLEVGAMPRQLLAWAGTAGSSTRYGATSDEALRQVLVLVRDRTGHDFSHYKMSTVRRRIERRMNIHQVAGVADYVRRLQSSPDELDQLFREMLIGVTSFFRDPPAWEALTPQIDRLLLERPDGHVIRAWVPGCSTAEEACSLAILLRERMEATGRTLPVQVFATDLNERAIEAARAGVWPAGIANDISPERLARFFTRGDNDVWRVTKPVREMLVFAVHNLIADPPFTRLDLLCCRNLLIYLDAALQKRLFPVFHYSLRPDGLLFLGSSETVSSSPELFETVDKKWRIYRRAETAPGAYVAELPASTVDRRLEIDASSLRPAHVENRRELDRLADRMLLRDLVPPTVLVRESGEVVYVHGRTGRFLEPPEGGQEAPNIVDMAREGLAISISAAIRQAADSGAAVHRARVRTNGDTVAVDLRVVRLTEPPGLSGLYRISFEHTGVVPAITPVDEAAVTTDLTERLERELQFARESHRGAIAELESANEERQSTNEELQSANEELQSANEELETSKEELQSLNEELQTVNSELQNKVDELSQANNDMRNLLNGTDIATLFLDPELRIKRYTEQARNVIRLIPTDIGRPIDDLVSTLQYRDLVADARDVLRTLAPREVEVRSETGVSYLMRIMPYRTTDNVIDGLVLTFVNVTAFNALRDEQFLLLEALGGSPAGVFGQDRDMRITWASSPLFGHSPHDLVGRTDRDLFSGADASALAGLKQEVVSGGSPVHRRLTLSINGHPRDFMFYVAPKRDAAGATIGVSCVVMGVPDTPR